jgi:tetratricopeptide (TPR) repeat protein
MTTTPTTLGDVSALVRPQPIGVLEGAAGLLLVHDGPGVEALLADLAAGRLPRQWPGEAATLAAAHAGDTDAALASLGDRRDDAINRLVLAPTPEHLTAAWAAAGDDPLRGVVVSAAAYASGLSDQPPKADGLDGEFAVLALTVRAARAIEFKDSPGAVRAMKDAVPHAAAVGPALHGRVLGMLAEHRFRNQSSPESSLELYAEAVAVLSDTDLDDLRAGLQLEHGIACHQLADGQRHRLIDAIRSYQSALMVFTEDRDPERFAVANMHIGIAILTLPMTQTSDQVKLGVAVQSLRAALRVYRPDSHPWEWSSSQMNLANALQYLPSTHREENLQESVELYEEVLAHRSPRSDPAGYARVLANQANALAHLGVFDHAVAKYREARELFAGTADADAIDVIDRQLTEIETTREGTR